jgi:NADH-quinone oxidoreductase subunit N
MSKKGENVTLDDLSGLHKRNPLAAFILASSMFALAGIPPFAGFMGKWLLLNEALKSGFLTLVVIAAVNTAIGIYYYLTVARVVYFTEPEHRPAFKFERGVAALGVILVVIVTLLGIVPAKLLNAAILAVQF